MRSVTSDSPGELIVGVVADSLLVDELISERIVVDALDGSDEAVAIEL
ncbi:MAG: hypothetical protein R3C28_30965 [Pirellulaceae bacterium]